jgi:hypothetical protein
MFDIYFLIIDEAIQAKVPSYAKAKGKILALPNK